MFVLMWVTLLFSVSSSNADTGASLETFCQGDFCITLSKGVITAEAGLCVVIPCSFTTNYWFRPTSIVWFKCDQSIQKCGDSDRIFSRNSRRVQSGFSGRVSLLEPDVSRRNCSIFINDLTVSDSGAYQLRVNGYSDGFSYSSRSIVHVKDLTQKPTVTIPPLTEGQQTTLSCTAPGLCSGSAPEITWTFRRPGENDSNIIENIPNTKTENLNAAQRHSSTLTFTPSAKHHGNSVTCKVSFGEMSTEKMVTLNVTYVKEVKITGNTNVTEGETLNLTCSVESFPPSLITWTKVSDKNLQNGKEMNPQNNSFTNLEKKTETYLQKGSGEATFSISNVTAKDSGQYICTAKHLNITLMGKVDVDVIYVKEVKITGNTNVTEGETLNLTCNVESFPPSLITWTKVSDKNLQNGKEMNPQNDTFTNLEKKTETYLQKGSGEATFSISNVTAKDSGQYICTAKHLNITLMGKIDVDVIYVKEVKITGNTNVTEGETLNLTCSVESFPPSLITWTKVSDKNLQNGKEMNPQNDTFTNLEKKTETYLQKGSGEATFSISNVTAKDSGQYICTAKHLNITLMGKVDVDVIYMKKPVITGNTTLGKADTLNLTCSVESFPPSYITWTLHGSNTDLQNDTGSATLVISNVKADHSGRYICTAKHLDRTVTVFADVAVTWFPSIFNNSGCEIQSEVLTCGCISEGFPLPTIKWPLLKNQKKYSVITTVTNHTVNSTITVTVKDHSNISAECLSSNQNGEAKENLSIRLNVSGEEDKDGKGKIFSWLEVIIAFFIGVLLTAVLCLLPRECHRKRQKSSGNLNETVEMVTSQEDPLIDADHVVEDDQTYDQEVAEGGEAVAAEKAALNLNGGPKDLEYASIDFSKLKRKSTGGAAKKRDTETEYAEIKKKVTEQREGNGEEEDEVSEDKEEEVMIGEDEETKDCVPEEEEGEDMAVYSNVKEIMNEI
uniref:vascular cell adhesion protein 1-like n=1 Tax=Semicossyphus pulcher TaxID=241346 RepID=UPI0037E790E6